MWNVMRSYNIPAQRRHDGRIMKIQPSKVKSGLLLAAGMLLLSAGALAQESKVSRKPILNGSHWVAVAGKPLSVAAGAGTFQRGGNAVDAAVVMIAASATIWDTMGWGGETQALIYHPQERRVYGINALGVAPSGATPEFFRSLGMQRLPQYGPLAAVTPGTPGGIFVMLARFGTISLEAALQPALELAAGYPIDPNQAQTIESNKQALRRWDDSARVLLPNADPKNERAWAAPRSGEIFVQSDLQETLQKLIDAERTALEGGATREAAIMAAYERFYRGDIAHDIAAATQAAGGLITVEDLANWQVHVEEPVTTNYEGIDVYKLTSWVQGPVMLQTLNILENFDLNELGYNSAAYVHTLYQAMNLAYADRDFYYGDPYVPPEEPIAGLLSKAYAADRARTIRMDRNDPGVRPGDPYPYQGERNPYTDLLERWRPVILSRSQANRVIEPDLMTHDEAFLAGTTSIQTADADGWLVSVTPSGGWIPAFIAGDTGVGLSQRMQSFVLSAEDNPFNVVQPGQRPRATLTPSIALRDGDPFMAFSVQGGDAQDQNLLQFFLNVTEFGMNVQQATEAANFNSYQLHASLGIRGTQPGRLILRSDSPSSVMRELERMGYSVELWEKTSGPITAIRFDPVTGTISGGASDFGDDYGIAW
jgi:gamma-glutamyltranspeptidase/glutathione hydrolase